MVLTQTVYKPHFKSPEILISYLSFHKKNIYIHIHSQLQIRWIYTHPSSTTFRVWFCFLACRWNLTQSQSKVSFGFIPTLSDHSALVSIRFELRFGNAWIRSFGFFWSSDVFSFLRPCYYLVTRTIPGQQLTKYDHNRVRFVVYSPSNDHCLWNIYNFASLNTVLETNGAFYCSIFKFSTHSFSILYTLIMALAINLFFFWVLK